MSAEPSPATTDPERSGGGRRLWFAAAIVLGLAILFAVAPILVLNELHARGVSTGATTVQLAVGGTVLAALFGLAYYVRPTTGYGPALAARALGGIVYLVLLAPYATARVATGSLQAAVGASGLFLWLAASPIIGLVAAFFVILADHRDPTVRRRREFPAAR